MRSQRRVHATHFAKGVLSKHSFTLLLHCHARYSRTFTSTLCLRHITSLKLVRKVILFIIFVDILLILLCLWERCFYVYDAIFAYLWEHVFVDIALSVGTLCVY